MSTCAVVVDTNILLHCKFIRELDWSALTPPPDAVIVPLRVIDELDEKKYSSEGRIARRSKKLLELIEESLADEDTRLAGDVRLVIETDPSSPRSTWADDDVIEACRRVASRYDSVGLLTNDTGLRIRAVARLAGVATVTRPPLSFIPSATSDDAETRKLKQRLSDATRNSVDLTVAFTGDQTHLEPDLPKEVEIDFTVDSVLRDMARSVPSMRYREREASSRLSLALSTDPTKDQVNDFNAERREWIDSYEKWLTSLVDLTGRRAAAISLPLAIRNRGNATAQDVEIRFRVSPQPASVLVSADMLAEDAAGKEPEAPYRPEHNYDFPPAPKPFRFTDFSSDRIWDLDSSGLAAVARLEQVRPSSAPVNLSPHLVLAPRTAATSPVGGFTIEWEVYSTTPSFTGAGRLQIGRRQVAPDASNTQS